MGLGGPKCCLPLQHFTSYFLGEQECTRDEVDFTQLDMMETLAGHHSGGVAWNAAVSLSLNRG